MLASALLTVSLAAAAPADRQVEALLARMRKAYSSVATARFTIKTRTYGTQPADAKASVVYMAPKKVRAKVSANSAVNPDAAGRSITLTMVTDGEKVGIRGPDGSLRTRPYQLDGVNQLLFGNLETLCFWDWQRQLTTTQGGNMRESQLKLTKEDWNGKSWTVLEETAPKQNLFVRYYIDPRTNLIWRTVLSRLPAKDLVGDFQVVNLELNPKLPANTFEVPTPGVKV